MADKWDEAAKKLSLGKYGSAPKDPVITHRAEDFEFLEFEGIALSETMVYDLLEEAIELVSFKINLAKSVGKERGRFMLGPRLREIIGNEPMNVCLALNAKTKSVINIYGLGVELVIAFSK